jgi:hypothetical protein
MPRFEILLSWKRGRRSNPDAGEKDAALWWGELDARWVGSALLQEFDRAA